MVYLAEKQNSILRILGPSNAGGILKIDLKHSKSKHLSYCRSQEHVYHIDLN